MHPRIDCITASAAHQAYPDVLRPGFAGESTRMLDWLKNDDDGHSDPSMRTPASAAQLLAGMRGRDPAAALEELAGWIEKGLPDRDAKARSEVLSKIHDSGSAHVGALLAQFVG